MNELSRLLYNYLIKTGISEENALIVNIFLLSVISLLGLFLIDYISKKIIRVVFINFASKIYKYNSNNFFAYIIYEKQS